RPFPLDWRPKFFANPCESAPVSEDRRVPSKAPTAAPLVPVDAAVSSLELVRQLVAGRAELPIAAVQDESRLLSDLHLNSITVGQLVAEAARRMRLPPLVSLTDFANATVAGIARALEELARTGPANGSQPNHKMPPGVDSWIRVFTVTQIPKPLPAPDAGSLS